MQMEETMNEYLDIIEDGRGFEFFTVENDVIDREDLSWNEKMVYIAFCRYANQKTLCFPSYNKLARKTDISRKTVIETVKSLIEKGLIHKILRTVEGKNESTSNLYVVKSAKTKQNPPSVVATPPSVVATPPSVVATPPSVVATPPSVVATPPSVVATPPPENLAPCNADATRVCDTPQNSYKDQSYKSPFRNINLERTNQSVSPMALCQTADRPTEKKVSHIKSQEKPKPQLPVCEITEADIKHQIGYSSLAPLGNTDLLDEVVLNMFDMYHSSEVKIKNEVKPQSVVHSVLSKVTYWHIVYILERFNQVTTTIKNKKGYLQTMIYTSVLEKQAHFTNEVKVDNLALAEEFRASQEQGPELADEELERFYVDLS